MANGDHSIYDTLNSERREIRVIEIVTYAGKSHYKLHTVSLRSRPRFSALSYVWGDANITETIVVNGRRVSVTRNLAAALRSFRHNWQEAFPGRDERELRLWADALSINQSNTPERNSQIKLMREIYSSADLVLSWLGPSNAMIESALANAGYIAREMVEKWADLLRIADGDQRLIMDFNWMARYPMLHQAGPSFWDAIVEFDLLPYWERIWIMQEVILSKNVLFACGTTLVDEAGMFLTMNWLEACRVYFGHTPVTKPDFFHDEAWRKFELLRLQKQTFRMQRLMGIRTFREEEELGAGTVDWSIPHFCMQSSRASNPRDYIYGVLGLTDLPIEPDYKKSVYEVYHNYIMRRVESIKCIDWFGFAGIGDFELESSEENLPSWIPDYARHASLPSPPNLAGLADAKIFDEEEPVFEIRGNTFFVRSIMGPRIMHVQAQSFVENSEEFKISGVFLDFVLDPMQRFVANDTGIHRLKAVLDIMLARDIQTGIPYLTMALSLIHLLREIVDSQFGLQLYQEQLPHRESWASMTEHRIGIFMPHCSPGEIRGFRSQIAASSDGWTNTTLIRLKLVQLQSRYRFIELEGGYLGVGPLYTEEMDSVCAVHGCGKLLLVRECGRYYKLVGECFVLGLMGGEMRELIRTGASSRRTIALV